MFGHELFSNPNVTASLNILDPGYIIKNGDSITVSEFGALPDVTTQIIVDTNGNLEVPGVGPVHVAGLPASAVNGVVGAAAAQVFSTALKIYAAPATTSPIIVQIAGPAVNPGPFQGASTDSVVAWLQRAGGIDSTRGSYRNIIVKRNGQIIYQVDLYAFLRTGELPPMTFKQNDIIIIGQQGPTVSVYGAARGPFSFELAQATTATGEEIIYYAQPRPEADHVGLLGVRGGKPFNLYVPIGEFGQQPLHDDDRVLFSADAVPETIVVRVTGAYTGAGSYVVPRQTSLADLLARISLAPLADKRWIHLQRVSAAYTQKQLLSEGLARLQKAVYTQPNSTATIAAANTAQATSIQQYINFANQIQPEGDVALPPDTDLKHVFLEPDDTIVIPFKSQVVTIGGEINEPQAMIYQPGASAISYVRRAGGFDEIADRGRILVIHPDGTTQVNAVVLPGDRILVLPRLPGHLIDLMIGLSQILYQSAIAGEAASRF
jgi:protein involved in polysaccharide export with SLBB domain